MPPSRPIRPPAGVPEEPRSRPRLRAAAVPEPRSALAQHPGWPPSWLLHPPRCASCPRSPGRLPAGPQAHGLHGDLGSPSLTPTQQEQRSTSTPGGFRSCPQPPRPGGGAVLRGGDGGCRAGGWGQGRRGVTERWRLRSKGVLSSRSLLLSAASRRIPHPSRACQGTTEQSVPRAGGSVRGVTASAEPPPDSHRRGAGTRGTWSRVHPNTLSTATPGGNESGDNQRQSWGLLVHADTA